MRSHRYQFVSLWLLTNQLVNLNIDFPTTGSIGKKLKKAARAEIKLAIILGGDELVKNNVQLRNLADGTQSEVMMNDLADVVAAALLAP